MFSRKFFLIFIGVFTEFFPRNSKATVFLVLITVYLYFQIIFKPFKYEHLNRHENISLFVCFFTGNIGINLFSEKIKTASNFFVFLTVLMNLGFLSFWLQQFLKQVSGEGKIQFLCRKLLTTVRRICQRRSQTKQL